MTSNSSGHGISRRAVIGYGALGVGVIGAGVVGFELLSAHQSPGTSPAQLSTPSTGVTPPVLRSSNGVLTVNLEAAYVDTTVGGKPARLMTYNGVSPAPTWLVRPGDTITVNFSNKLGESTNLHTHGLHISPAGDSDNVFVDIPDGGTHQYVYQLGTDHPTGISWYHPHMHGMSANQVFAGLYGAIIVEDVNAAADVVDRVIVISDITLRNDGVVASPNQMSKMMGREGDLILVNGQPSPAYTFTAGASERWRIVNACTSRYLDLGNTGASFSLLGIDSSHYTEPRSVDRIKLLPGNRADVLVSFTGNEAALTYTTVPHPDSMNMGTTATYSNLPIATFAVGSSPISTPVVEAFAATSDLRTSAVDNNRTLTLSMPNMGGGMGGNGGGMGGMGAGNFKINGAAFNPDVINEEVRIGTVEEWTIVNSSTMDHPFHLHVWPMQIVSIGGAAVNSVEYQDVVNVPAKSQTVVRIHFNEFPGKTVYHCHILDHEDLGMMGVLNAT